MSDDIVIKGDGSIYISDITGDAVKASPSQVIEQKLYASFMEMDPRVITSRKFTSYEDINTAMMQYLHSYFVGDSDVEASNISIEITENPGNDGVALSVSYSGKTASGEGVSLSSMMNYSLSAGALSSVNYLPEWLTTSYGEGTKDIEHYIYVSSPASEFELPLEPYYSEDDPLGSMIRVLSPGSVNSDTSELAFTIELYSGRTKYPVSSFVSTSIRRSKVIYEISVLSSTVSYNIIKEYGEYVIVVPEDTESGTITGTAKVITAVTHTDEFSTRNEEANNLVFPLRRTRGKYFVVFPKSLPVGSYIIKYKGLTGE